MSQLWGFKSEGDSTTTHTSFTSTTAGGGVAPGFGVRSAVPRRVLRSDGEGQLIHMKAIRAGLERRLVPGRCRVCTKPRPPIRAGGLSCGGVFAAVSTSSGERRTSLEPVDLAGQLDGQIPPAASPWATAGCL